LEGLLNSVPEELGDEVANDSSDIANQTTEYSRELDTSLVRQNGPEEGLISPGSQLESQPPSASHQATSKNTRRNSATLKRTPLSTKSANDVQVEAPRRRSRGAVKSYAEPSLRTKMRREHDHLVSAIVDSDEKENSLPLASKRASTGGGVTTKKRRRDSARPLQAPLV
jgi:cell wall-associated NlpC family hydrolase